VVEGRAQILDCLARQEWPVLGLRLVLGGKRAQPDLPRADPLDLAREDDCAARFIGLHFREERLDLLDATGELPRRRAPLCRGPHR
jgi:hypothetical protein